MDESQQCWLSLDCICGEAQHKQSQQVDWEFSMGVQGQKSTAVDDYIAMQSDAAQLALNDLRQCIWQAAPNLTELMNYQIPAFALVIGGKRDSQILIAGYAKHVGFYPSPAVITAFAKQLAQYKFAKGSVQFPLHQPIPKDLVLEMVKFRLSLLSDHH